MLRIDLATGDRTVVSSSSVGSGPAFFHPTGLAIEANGAFVVAEPGLYAILRVDASSGDRTVLSGCVDGCTSVIGSGELYLPSYVAVEASGTILVADPGVHLLLRVDPVTGDRTSFAPLADVRSLAIDVDGSIIAGGEGGSLTRIDPVTGAATLVSSLGQVGGGPNLGAVWGVAVATQSDDRNWDLDGDGVPHASDNCLFVDNPVQKDADLDGFGNLCDADFEENGVVGGSDFSDVRFCFGKAVGPGQGREYSDPTCAESDMSGDGVVGGPDFNLFRLSFGKVPGPSGLRCALPGLTTPCPAP